MRLKDFKSSPKKERLETFKTEETYCPKKKKDASHWPIGLEWEYEKESLHVIQINNAK